MEYIDEVLYHRLRITFHNFQDLTDAQKNSWLGREYQEALSMHIHEVKVAKELNAFAHLTPKQEQFRLIAILLSIHCGTRALQLYHYLSNAHDNPRDHLKAQESSVTQHSGYATQVLQTVKNGGFVRDDVAFCIQTLCETEIASALFAASKDYADHLKHADVFGEDITPLNPMLPLLEIPHLW